MVGLAGHFCGIDIGDIPAKGSLRFEDCRHSNEIDTAVAP